MRLERETADSFVIWRGAAGMVCTVHDALIPLFNLSARTLVSLISKFLSMSNFRTPCRHDHRTCLIVSLCGRTLRIIRYCSNAK